MTFFQVFHLRSDVKSQGSDSTAHLWPGILGSEPPGKSLGFIHMACMDNKRWKFAMLIKNDSI